MIFEQADEEKKGVRTIGIPQNWLWHTPWQASGSHQFALIKLDGFCKKQRLMSDRQPLEVRKRPQGDTIRSNSFRRACMKGLIGILMGLPLCASSISGTLTDALTHRPVTGAHVVAGQANAVSDSAGFYSLRDLMLETTPSRSRIRDLPAKVSSLHPTIMASA